MKRWPQELSAQVSMATRPGVYNNAAAQTGNYGSNGGINTGPRERGNVKLSFKKRKPIAAVQCTILNGRHLRQVLYEQYLLLASLHHLQYSKLYSSLFLSQETGLTWTPLCDKSVTECAYGYVYMYMNTQSALIVQLPVTSSKFSLDGH